MKINNRVISVKKSPYVIAELSANHNGSIKRAIESIKVAKECGVDAVKIQTYTADTITIKSDRDEFQVRGGLWNGYSLYDLYSEAETPYKWHKVLFDYAERIGVTIFSSPFDFTAVDLLEELGAPAYKIASPEIVDIPLIKRVAQTQKPIIISTGMANLEEISEAVEVAYSNGCKSLALLHCVSGYPTPVNEANLLTITDLRKRFDVPIGLSDHTMGVSISVASVALGASIIEKHFTLSRLDKGPDSEFSIEPSELRELCVSAKAVHQSIGNVSYNLTNSEKISYKSRRSLYVVKDISKGEKFTPQNIRSIRPGLGLHTRYYERILGKRAMQDIDGGTPLAEDHIENWC